MTTPDGRPEETPLDRLRVAIETFLLETDTEGTLQGFVVLGELTRIDTDVRPGISRVQIRNVYASDLSPSMGAGLARGFAKLAERIVADSMMAGDL